MNTLRKSVVAALLSTAVASQAIAAEPVASVDLDAYVGLWHELRRIPNEFQDNTPDGFSACVDTTAEYGALPRGRISVTNTCLRTRDDGEATEEIAEAVARVVGGSNNAKLKVNFTGFAILRWLGIGDGDYWVYGLGPVDSNGDYSWALVGSPDLTYGWVLARDPALDEATLESILDLATSLGFDRALFQ